MRRHAIIAAAAASFLLAVIPLTACAPGSAGHTTAPSASSTSVTPPSPSPSPTVAPVALPTDCRAILSPEVLLQLRGVPLNDPAFGSGTGVQSDGSLTCVWADPRADTTSLWTQISRTDATHAQTTEDGLRTGGYGCYASQGGMRCEKTWKNKTYPVTDGRTWFWRDDIVIDSHYSNLAPQGYTASIVTHLFG